MVDSVLNGRFYLPKVIGITNLNARHVKPLFHVARCFSFKKHTAFGWGVSKWMMVGFILPLYWHQAMTLNTYLVSASLV